MMNNGLDRRPDVAPDTTNRIVAPVTGRVVGIDPIGVWVSFNDSEPSRARLLSGVDKALLMLPESIGREVLLVFENGDPSRPIVMGVLESVIDELVTMEIETPPPANEPLVDAKIDGKRVVLEAADEIVLKCGKGSITIAKSGKITIKGTDLLSRSSGINRIKGGTVGIN